MSTPSAPGPQKVEILSADGKPVDSGNPLPVNATFSGSISVGAVDQGKTGSAGQSWYVQDGSGLLATASKQDTGNTALSTINTTLTDGSQRIGGSVAVTGPLTDTQLRASAVPISAATLPLPTGAAKDSTLTDGTQRVGGTVAVSAASLPLPSNAAQETGGNLASILAQLDSKTSTLAAKTQLPTSIGQTTKTASLSVAIASDQTVPVSFTPSGTTDVNLTKIGGSSVALGQMTMSASLPVAIASNQSSLPVTVSNAFALDTSVNGILVAQASTTSGQTGPLVQGAVTATAPTYTDAKTSPLSLTTGGALRVSAVGSTVNPATQKITARDVGSTTTAGQSNQNIITGSATAGSTASFVLQGISTVRFEITGTWTGTLVPEISPDSGTTWYTLGAHVTGTAVNTASWTSNGSGNLNVGSATNFRMRATTAWTGTATILIAESAQLSSVYLANAVRIGNQAGTQADVTAASTASVATQPALVVALSPNSPTPLAKDFTGSGSVTNGQPTLTFTGLAGVGTLDIQITGSWSGTITFAGSTDGSTFTTMYVYPIGAGGPGTPTTTANGWWSLYASGLVSARLTGAGMTGSASVTVEGSGTGGRVRAVQGNPAGTAAQSWLMAITDQKNGPAAVSSTVPTSGAGLVVRNVYPAQASTTSGQTGPLIQGAVTTAAPTYTTAQTSPLSLTTAGALRVDASASTQPVSGTVTANIGTSGSLALDASVTGLQVSQGSTTSGQKGGLTFGAVTTSAPTYTTAQTSPLSLTTGGLLRVTDPGLPTLGTAGTAASTVLTVQGIASMTPVQVSQATASNLLAQVFGGASNGSLVSGNPVLVAGYDGTSARTLRTDTSGNQVVGGGGTAGSPSGGVLTVQGSTSMTALLVAGAASSGSAISGSPVPAGGTDGTNVRYLAVDTSGRQKNAGYSSFSYITAAGTAAVKTSAGILRSISIVATASAGSLTVYDANNATTNPIAGFTLTSPITHIFNLVVNNGITVVTGAGFNGQVTVVYD